VRDRTVKLLALPGETVYLRAEAMQGELLPRKVRRVEIYLDANIEYVVDDPDISWRKEQDVCDYETALRLAMEYHLTAADEISRKFGKRIIWKYVTQDELDSMKAGDDK